MTHTELSPGQVLPQSWGGRWAPSPARWDMWSSRHPLSLSCTGNVLPSGTQHRQTPPVKVIPQHCSVPSTHRDRPSVSHPQAAGGPQVQISSQITPPCCLPMVIWHPQAGRALAVPGALAPCLSPCPLSRGAGSGAGRESRASTTLRHHPQRDRVTQSHGDSGKGPMSQGQQRQAPPSAVQHRDTAWGCCVGPAWPRPAPSHSYRVCVPSGSTDPQTPTQPGVLSLMSPCTVLHVPSFTVC